MKKTFLLFILLLLLAAVYISCSKSGSDSNSNNNPPNPCAGTTVAVTGTVTSATSGQNNGKIEASATGGSGFSFSLNNGSFQSSGTFSNLAPGSYTIIAKNSTGCTGSQSFAVAAVNTCSGVTIVVNATAATTATPCGGPGGGISASATGSTGFTFSVDNGAFQASGDFTGLAAGNHTVVAKDANGCSASGIVNVGTTPAGPLFGAVLAIIQNNCVSCHNNTIQNGGMNWAVPCNIITFKDRIKVRAVDQAGTASQMPQPPNPALSATDRQKIVDWINAGGTYSN